MNHSDWSKKDLEYIWHPCSQMKDYETLPPIVIERGQGIHLYDVDGKRYLDVVSSWWCNLLGHSHPKINRAIKEQLDSLEHVIFANFSHRPAITLCEELMKKIPRGLCKFNFSDNGSASIESAMNALVSLASIVESKAANHDEDAAEEYDEDDFEDYVLRFCG